MQRSKTDYLQIRVEPADKNTLTFAASLIGVSLSEFVRDASGRAARDVLCRELAPVGPDEEPAA